MAVALLRERLGVRGRVQAAPLTLRPALPPRPGRAQVIAGGFRRLGLQDRGKPPVRPHSASARLMRLTASQRLREDPPLAVQGVKANGRAGGGPAAGGSLRRAAGGKRGHRGGPLEVNGGLVVNGRRAGEGGAGGAAGSQGGAEHDDDRV